MKKLMKLRHKKGFTLTELIIVVAIIAILMTCVAAFAGPVQQIVKSSAASADALQVNKIVADYIENRLSYASYIDIHVAKDVESISTDTEVVGGSTGFTAIVNKLNSSIENSNNKGRGGMLIFHYEPDAIEPYKSSYEVYDIPILKTSTNINSLLFTGNAKNTRSELNGAVFSDDFYLSNNQIVILPELSVVPNQMRNTLLMRLDIRGYGFDDDYYDASAPDADNIYIKDSLLSDYYEAYSDAEAIAIGTGKTVAESTVLSGLSVKKTGTTEGIAFQLRNTNRGKAIEYNSDGSVKTNEWEVHGQDGGNNGEDIIIFYYIPMFGN